MDADRPANRIAVEYQPAWLTWLAATSTCLRALGVDHDITDLAGHSGYAFCLSIHAGLCPSGPTVLDWSRLSGGAHNLGRATQEFLSFTSYPVDRDNPDYRAACDAMFDFVRAEVDQGRPVVVWGAYVPEFAAVVGTGADCYHVASFKEVIGEDQPPIGKYDLDNVAVTYALAFPAPCRVDQRQAAVRTLFQARQLLGQPQVHPGYANGPAAYTTWAGALEQGKAHPLGNAYNAACWWEARHHAAGYTRRLAERLPGAAGPLTVAADHLERVAGALAGVKGLFPFPPAGELDPAACAEAATYLATARVDEEAAITAVNQACELIQPGS